MVFMQSSKSNTNEHDRHQFETNELITFQHGTLRDYSRRPKREQLLIFARVLISMITNHLYSGDMKNVLQVMLRDEDLLSSILQFLSHPTPAAKALAEGLFWITIDNNDTSLLSVLLKAGFNLQGQLGQDKIMTKPLHQACSVGSFDIVRMLVDAGADVNELDASRSTPLDCLFSPTGANQHDLPDNTYWEICGFLFNMGGSATRWAYLGLDNAVRAGKSRIIILLLTSLQGKERKFICLDDLIYAMKLVLGNTDFIVLEDAFEICQKILSLVTQLSDLKTSSYNPYELEIAKNGAFDSAVVRASVPLLKLLSSSGFAIGPDAIPNAIRTGDMAIVDFLRMEKAPVSPESVLEAALEHFSSQQTMRLVEQLQRHEPCPQDLVGHAFIAAVKYEKEDLAAFFIEKFETVETNGLRKLANKYLCIAARKGVEWVFRLVLRHRSKFNIFHSELQASMAYAIQAGAYDVVHMLVDAGADLSALPPQALQGPLLRQEFAFFRRLVDAGARVNVGLNKKDGFMCLSSRHEFSNAHIFSILPLVVASKDQELIKSVLDAGADVHGSDINGFDIRGLYDAGIDSSVTTCLRCHSLKKRTTADSQKPKHIHGDSLISAVQTGDRAIVELLLSAGAHPNNLGLGQTSLTALTIAVVRRDLEIVRFLLSVGANPMDETALSAAVMHQNAEMVDILLRHASTYKYHPKRFGIHALQLAIAKQHYGMIQLLLSYGIDCSQFLKQNKCRYLVDWLRIEESNCASHLPRSTNSNPENHHGADYNKCPYPFMCHKSGVKNTSINLPWKSLEEVRYGASAFGYAIMIDSKLQDTEDVQKFLTQFFLDMGVSPNLDVQEVDVVGELLSSDSSYLRSIPRSALSVAISLKNCRLVKLLLQYGANINRRLPAGEKFTVLQLAALNGAIDIVKLLLDRGADVNEPPRKNGGTALQIASWKGFLSLASLLIERGADVNAPRAMGEGQTAVEFAAQHGRYDIVCLLLKNGLNLINDGNTQYVTALRLAEERGNMAIKELLELHFTKQLDQYLNLDTGFEDALQLDRTIECEIRGLEVSASTFYGC